MKTCCVGGHSGQLMERIKTFFWEVGACVKIEGEVSESFTIGPGV